MEPTHFTSSMEPRLRDVLNDPVVVALMQRDCVSQEEIVAMINAARGRLGFPPLSDDMAKTPDRRTARLILYANKSAAERSDMDNAPAERRHFRPVRLSSSRHSLFDVFPVP